MPENPMIIETGGGSNSGGGMWGLGEGGGMFVILFLLILFGMFGGGWGGQRGNTDSGGSTLGTVLPLVMGAVNNGGGHGCATAVADGFALNGLQSGINAIQHGQCTSTYEIVGAIKDCCCQTQGSVKDIRFDIANGLNSVQNLGRDIIENQNNSTRAILDYLAATETQRLRDENQALRTAASLSDQNAILKAAMDANKAEILRRTGAECPTAAYLVNAPTPVNFPVNSCGQVQFGNCGNGCGW